MLSPTLNYDASRPVKSITFTIPMADIAGVNVVTHPPFGGPTRFLKHVVTKVTLRTFNDDYVEFETTPEIADALVRETARRKS